MHQSPVTRLGSLYVHPAGQAHSQTADLTFSARIWIGIKKTGGEVSAELRRPTLSEVF